MKKFEKSASDLSLELSGRDRLFTAIELVVELLGAKAGPVEGSPWAVAQLRCELNRGSQTGSGPFVHRKAGEVRHGPRKIVEREYARQDRHIARAASM